jgi:exopolysaccharide biosynthesis polyprenyl glycosylphosphotransferase
MNFRLLAVDQIEAGLRPSADRGTSTWRLGRSDTTAAVVPAVAVGVRLAVTDLLIVAVAVFGSGFARFGADAEVRAAGSWQQINYDVLSAILIAAWWVTLGVTGTRGEGSLGYGSDEYRLLTQATFGFFGGVAILATVLKIDISRGYLAVALPVGLAGLLVERALWRLWLQRQRRRGRYRRRVLLVGNRGDAVRMAGDLDRNAHCGLQVVGIYFPLDPDHGTLPGDEIDLLIDRVRQAMAQVDADSVVVSGAVGLPDDFVRRLSWHLDAQDQHLMVAPSLTDIGAPRLRTRPVAGLPLIHVRMPRDLTKKVLAKRAFDLVGALLLVLLGSPVLLALAIIVRLTSPGPALYRQVRVGRDGQPFRMIKFRSMRIGADDALAELLQQQGTADRPLFKVTDDPRITPVGKVLRKYSLDELPQLFNVIAGTMSLVGPRPQRPAEVELYDRTAHRRLLVKPGMSGLWQVSGRSSLEWEDSIRLDLFYVDNWSLIGDVSIVLRTVREVVAPRGAV